MINIKTLSFTVLVGLFIYGGTLKLRFSAKKKQLTEAKATIKNQKSKIDSLDIVIATITKKSLADSANFASTVTDLQATLKAVQQQKNILKAENTELRAGAVRFKVNIFGKEKLVK